MSDDIRLADIIRPGNDGQVVLLGFPYDAGVERNGGRTGSRRGPEGFRRWMGRYGSVNNPELGIDLSALAVTDAGDVAPGLSLEEAHSALTEQVEAVLRKGGRPFVVGGGNDQSYANACALLAARPEAPVGVVNIDAHLDVRPLADGRAHSGSPFRLLLEDARFSGAHFIEFAAQGSQCSREHAAYVKSRGGRIFWLSEISRGDQAVEAFRNTLGKLAWDCGSLFVSFDLDAVRAADAPGVSCPGTLGLRAREAVDIAFAAGCHPQVELFDLSEYNPEVEEERTGRLAAAMFYHFCLGVALRHREKTA